MDMRKLSENRVTVASSTTIPLRCVVNVNCKVEQASVVGGMTGVLEPEQRFEERYSLGIIKVVATVKEGEVPAQTDYRACHIRKMKRKTRSPPKLLMTMV